MKRKGILMLITSAFMIFSICLTPAAIFKIQDYQLNIQTFACESSTGKLSTSARDIPLVQALWERKPLSEDFYLPYFTLMQSDITLDGTFTENPTFQELEELHKAGVLPAEAIENTMVISINSADISEINQYVIKLVSTGEVEFQHGSFIKRYSIESTLGKVTSLHLFNQNNMFNGTSFDQIIKSYVAYLGLDVLDDWEYKGSYAESKDARLIIICTLQEDLFFLSIITNS